ncbi:DUF4128 domain-containing protein [Rhizobium binae]|uniref:DUF4128 domain-containing protein n=1 Tax=Rhizobium binae TaxID=1138190 RepID=UPI001C83284E|nr:DUF4128 domain-containing protein [Rhizobium binae]MBX4944637.1 hypothetical protein [Rhizobium binae]MBX4980668.1 hypothetical protein [Rhizobium binae]
MADYAGAEEAIRQRLADNWQATRITDQNEQPEDPWPPVNANGELEPWINLEIECLDSMIVGQGRPGNHVYRYDGLIQVHVFTPAGTKSQVGKQLAVSVGEIFRRKTFYDDISPGCCVRTEDPYPAEGNSRSDDGNWFGTTMMCPFVYWHRG